MSTVPLNKHSSHASFDTIDEHVNRLELEGEAQPSEGKGRVERILGVYSGVRPILAALSAVTLIPGRWREALRLFITMMDELALPPEPPAHTLPIPPHVAME